MMANTDQVTRNEKRIAGDKLYDAMQALLLAGAEADDADQFMEAERIRRLYSIVDYSRRVLLGDSAFYRCEKVEVLAGEAAQLRRYVTEVEQ